MRKQTKLATLALGVLTGLSGCEKSNVDKYGKGKIDGYHATAFVDGNMRTLVIHAGDVYKEGVLLATDVNNDGRFDEITLDTLPKGHPLEQYANLRRLEEVYSQIVGE